MHKAFIDTTILTNILLKSGELRNSSVEALKRYDKTLLPVYAIKEFKAGPLANYAYIHNKLVTEKSYAATLSALQRLSLTPQRYKTATALEALAEASKSSKKYISPELLEKYAMNPDHLMFEASRLAIKVLIFKSWKRRRSVTTDIVCPLPCYKEVPPSENKHGLIDMNPKKCQDGFKCSLDHDLKAKRDDLQKLKDSIDVKSDRIEDKRRSKVLKELIRKPKTPLGNNDCRALGDAIFAFFAPVDAVILTTNIKDHEPLARSLGKSVISP